MALNDSLVKVKVNELFASKTQGRAFNVLILRQPFSLIDSDTKVAPSVSINSPLTVSTLVCCFSTPDEL